MPLQIELRDREGVVQDAAEESWDSIRSMWPELDYSEYPILAGVDQDNNTMFNPLQCRLVGGEIARLLASPDPKPERLLRRVADLAARCGDAGDLELWFIGD